MIINLADLDVIFISYDEPNAEEHWADLLNKVPWAQRVHGVEGSDAAHKAAAKLSTTDRLVTVDGDNIIDEDFFNNQLILDEDNENAVFSWKGLNYVNGLTYGNGGLKCWPKTVIENMKTHELAESDESQVEFCWELNYIQMFNCYSTTYVNGSEFQAWRAGFREGVKMCLQKGKKISTDGIKDMHRRNKQHLEIWLNIGVDVRHGETAIAGARHGVHKTMFTNWNHHDVKDFIKLQEIYDNDYRSWSNFTDDIESRLGLKIVHFDSKQSAFFKKYYNQHENLEFMLTEMDYIRKIEKW